MVRHCLCTYTGVTIPGLPLHVKNVTAEVGHSISNLYFLLQSQVQLHFYLLAIVSQVGHSTSLSKANNNKTTKKKPRPTSPITLAFSTPHFQGDKTLSSEVLLV